MEKTDCGPYNRSLERSTELKRISIPLIGNGDLFTAEKAVNALTKSCTDGVMIGRGAMGNPWIFRDIKIILNGGTPSPVTVKEREEIIMRHYRLMLDEMPANIAVREMRKHIGWYIKGMHGAGRFRNEINSCDSHEKVFEMIRLYFQSAERENDFAEEAVTR